MDSKELQDVRAILAHRGFAGRAAYEYYTDRYALKLLRWAVGGARPQEMHVRDLKRSRFASLLAKPRVSSALANAGRGLVTPALLDRHDDARDARRYVLTLGTWGRENARAPQTSRKGVNLVLQMNFDRRHEEAYERLVKPRRNHPPFEYRGHPISCSRKTLAWARIDLDLRLGEALIEEIQTDWLHEAIRVERYARRFVSGPCRHPFRWWTVRGSAKQVCRYFDAHLLPHVADWHDSMLLAALWLIRDLLGIRYVFFHTMESGASLKEMEQWDVPPRSIYTDLPRSFCFREERALPEFIARAWHSDSEGKTAPCTRINALSL